MRLKIPEPLLGLFSPSAMLVIAAATLVGGATLAQRACVRAVSVLLLCTVALLCTPLLPRRTPTFAAHRVGLRTSLPLTMAEAEHVLELVQQMLLDADERFLPFDMEFTAGGPDGLTHILSIQLALRDLVVVLDIAMLR